MIEDKKLVPDFHFGLRQKYFTTVQMQRLTEVIKHVPEEKQVCPAIFLHTAQTYDKV